VHAQLEQALFEMKRIIVGQDRMLERALVALLAGGHLLLEGVPGLAKTLTIKTLAATLGGTFQRVQFTPDLVPSDLVGTRIYRADTGSFETELGPVFCNFLLADEINRAPAKVQSALLEVMQEQQVTIGSTTYPVDPPFLVMATQNPIESEGTYPLPEAQTDRFMMKVVVGYPDFSEETEVVQRALSAAADLRTVVGQEDVLAAQRAALEIYVDHQVVEYSIALVTATRDPAMFGRDDLDRFIEFGASPRGSIFLVRAAQALALLRGRAYVLPRDIAELAKDVLRHRLVLSYDALAEETSADALLDMLIAAVPAPTLELAQENA
jgi:MoxR-like ATPase